MRGASFRAKGKAAPALICAGAAFLLFSCARDDDRARVDEAVARLRSGQTVREIELAIGSSAFALPGPAPADLPPDTPPEQAPSAGADPELERFFAELRQAYSPLAESQAALLEFRKTDPAANRPRSRFTDADLRTLARLARATRDAADEAAPRISALLEKSGALLSSPRGSLILAAAASDRGALAGFFGDAPEENLPVFPFGLAALIPQPGSASPSVTRRSNPFLPAYAAWLAFADDPSALEKRFARYRTYRDQDNPERMEPGPAPVSVALLDTGLDFVRFKELALFLGKSEDYADGDDNPWLPALGSTFTHGTGTAATLLSMISRSEPELLRERRIQIRMWKTHTLRQLLSRHATENGPSRDDTSWESRAGVPEAVQAQLEAKSAPDAPKAVVAPVGFGMRERIFKAGLPKDYLAAPWVWVMAAGNSAMDPRLSVPAPCFLDLPEAYRPRDRILCVGAAEETVNGPRPKSYSNFGPDVDVYAPDSYSELCPEGTSCAAPAVAAAVAQLAAKYPALDAKALRTVILGAATLRYFDPATMMPRAYAIAEKLAGSAELKE